MLNGDIYPVSPPPFSLEGYNVAMNPREKVRAWQVLDPFPTGQASWGLAEQKRLLRQLARLKYNRLHLVVRTWKPSSTLSLEESKSRRGYSGMAGSFP